MMVAPTVTIMMMEITTTMLHSYLTRLSLLEDNSCPIWRGSPQLLLSLDGEWHHRDKRQTPHAPLSQNDDDEYEIPILSRGSAKMRPLARSKIEKSRNNDKNKLQQPPPTQHNAEETESLNLHILQPSSDLCITVTDFALDGAHLVR